MIRLSIFLFFIFFLLNFFFGGGRYRDEGQMQKNREMNRIKIHDVKTHIINKKKNGIFTVFLVPYCLQFNSISNLQCVLSFKH